MTSKWTQSQLMKNLIPNFISRKYLQTMGMEKKNTKISLIMSGELWF